MLVLISVKTGLYLGPWANVVVDLRVEIALHDILLVVPIVCACPAALSIGETSFNLDVWCIFTFQEAHQDCAEKIFVHQFKKKKNVLLELIPGSRLFFYYYYFIII